MRHELVEDEDRCCRPTRPPAARSAARRAGAAASSSSMPSERAMRSAFLKPMPRISVSRYGSLVSTATTSSPYSRTSRAASPAPMPCVKRKLSTSRIAATSRHAATARSDALPRDRAAGLRAHLAQPLRVAVELLEDVLRAEVLDDRARERRADAGDAPGQPELDPRRRLRQRGVERLDDELPAVPRMLGERARADELLARSDVAERAGEAERLAVALLAEHRAPDRELRVVGDVARARRRERDADLGRAADPSAARRGRSPTSRPTITHPGTLGPGAENAVT